LAEPRAKKLNKTPLVKVSVPDKEAGGGKPRLGEGSRKAAFVRRKMGCEHSTLEQQRRRGRKDMLAPTEGQEDYFGGCFDGGDGKTAGSICLSIGGRVGG